MGFVVTILGLRPAPRQDGDPWTDARWEEAVTAAGPWTALETDPLIPVDPDPTEPAVRSLTTTEAQLVSGWYRIVFLDAALNEGPTQAFAASGAGVLLPPSASMIRDRSDYLKTLFPPDPLDPEVEDALREVVGDATALVESLTCRTLDAALAADARLARLAVRAVTMKAERVGSIWAAKARRASIRSLALKSFTAGPYSETYFGPEEATSLKALDPDRELHEVLWALATEECRERWLALWTGVHEPASAVQEVAWNRRRRY